MKALIYVLDEASESGFRIDEIECPINNVHAFDGMYADMIEINGARICGIDDIDSLIDMLTCARQCFMDGNGERMLKATTSLLKTLRPPNLKA